MHGNLFALAVVALSGVTLAVARVHGVAPCRRSLIRGGVATAATVAVLSFAAYSHACDRGGPTGPVLLGAAWAGILWAATSHARARRRIWLGWLLLTCWGVGLCHCESYVGNRQWRAGPSQRALAQARNALSEAAQSRSTPTLTEGWVEQSWRAATGEPFPMRTTFQDATVTRCWHTWFTGVYRMHSRTVGIWSPGGSCKACAGALEIRPRPLAQD